MTRNVAATSTELKRKENLMRMKEIQGELESQRDLLQDQNGYTQILTFIQDYFAVMAKLTASMRLPPST
ncbi:MAG: hypothetical protein ACTSYU_02965 [Promethearchaeota archaeon]